MNEQPLSWRTTRAAFDARGELGNAVSSAHTLSWTLTALGRGDELAAALRRFDTPWALAAVAYCEGAPLAAAEILAEMGAVAEEAYARLAASRAAANRGGPVIADAQLQRALAFYRAVGATRYVAEGETLLAAPA